MLICKVLVIDCKFWNAYFLLFTIMIITNKSPRLLTGFVIIINYFKSLTISWVVGRWRNNGLSRGNLYPFVICFLFRRGGLEFSLALGLKPSGLGISTNHTTRINRCSRLHKLQRSICIFCH
jgi:hypothetical protein